MPITRSVTANTTLNNSYITMVEGNIDDKKNTYDDVVNIYRNKLADSNAEILTLQEQITDMKLEIKQKNKIIRCLEKRIPLLEKNKNDLSHYKEMCNFQKLELDELKNKQSEIAVSLVTTNQYNEEANARMQEKIERFDKIIIDLNKLYSSLYNQYENSNLKITSLKYELQKNNFWNKTDKNYTQSVADTHLKHPANNNRTLHDVILVSDQNGKGIGGIMKQKYTETNIFSICKSYADFRNITLNIPTLTNNVKKGGTLILMIGNSLQSFDKYEFSSNLDFVQETCTAKNIKLVICSVRYKTGPDNELLNNKIYQINNMIYDHASGSNSMKFLDLNIMDNNLFARDGTMTISGKNVFSDKCMFCIKNGWGVSSNLRVLCSEVPSSENHFL